MHCCGRKYFPQRVPNSMNLFMKICLQIWGNRTNIKSKKQDYLLQAALAEDHCLSSLQSRHSCISTAKVCQNKHCPMLPPCSELSPKALTQKHIQCFHLPSPAAHLGAAAPTSLDWFWTFLCSSHTALHF